MEAIIACKTIRAVYHTQSRNELTEREIDPYYLVPRDQRFYLIGYCRAKREIRTFRMSRFRHVELTGNHFDKGDFSIAQYMKHTWSIERGDSLITFKIKFHPDVARYVKEEELFVRPKMTDLPDGGLLFEVTVNHEREFMNWVVQYGPSAEILEPPSVREKFKEQAAALGTVVWAVSANVRLTERKVSLVKVEGTFLERLYDAIRKEPFRRKIVIAPSYMEGQSWLMRICRELGSVMNTEVHTVQSFVRSEVEFSCINKG